jgi:protein SCO1/2
VTGGESGGTGEAAPAGSTFLRRWIWVLAAVVGVLSLTLLKVCQSRTLQRLPVLYVLPAFELQDQQGKPFGSQQLDGKVWVASFIFTSCRTECPAIGRANRTLQDKLAGTDVRLISVSVDPEFDTPAALTRWGEEFGVDPARWHLLTGERKAIEALVIDGFRTHMGDRMEERGLVQIAHTMKLVLVDQHRGIRHYFDATDDKAVALVVDHAKALSQEGAAR